jgi:hypothetical protein
MLVREEQTTRQQLDSKYNFCVNGGGAENAGGPGTRRGVAGPLPMQTARKPDSVLDDHSSRRRVTAALEQPTRKFRLIRPRADSSELSALAHRADTLVPAGECGRDPCLFGLAPCGVYHAIPLTRDPVRSYRTFSPLPSAPLRGTAGGIFSVALAVYVP